MRSGELAELAAVTVRALRHYHQIGLLDEPGRGANGYRDYDVEHLIRVLRIRRLAALGVPLDRMGAVLDDDPRDQAQLLAEVERSIDAEIRRLQEQRELVRSVRTGGTSPDLPPRLAAIADRLSAAGMPAASLRTEREHGLLMAHLLGDAPTERYAETYERLVTPEILAEVVPLTHAFEALVDGADPAAIQAYVDRFLTVLEPMLRELGASLRDALDDDLAAAILEDYAASAFTDAQQDALGRIAARLGA